MNIKNSGVSSKPSLLGFLLGSCLIVICLLTVSACQSKDLSREQAQKMITATQEFKDVTSFDYINRSLKDDKNKGSSVAKSADEPEAAAVQNRIDSYFREAPRVGIADHFGLVYLPTQSALFTDVLTGR